jgi:hypothetical protein
MKKKIKEIWVTKSSGEQAQFSKEKLRLSLIKSGASNKDIEFIISEIEKILYPGISTKTIYKKAFKLLRKASRPTAAKYKLKKALMELGPTGFPFERYFAEVLKQEGFSTKTGQILKGQCVTHEIDVIAKKDNKVILTECKFHADTRHKSDVKTPLYIHSRFLDLENQRKKNKIEDRSSYQGWIVTNTRFTGQALEYGACVGLYMLDWNYPKNGSLKERIDKAGLHPITCLTTLTKNEKRKLLQKMIVLSRDLCLDGNILLSIGINGLRKKRILAEASALSNL